MKEHIRHNFVVVGLWTKTEGRYTERMLSTTGWTKVSKQGESVDDYLNDNKDEMIDDYLKCDKSIGHVKEGWKFAMLVHHVLPIINHYISE